MGPIPQQLTYRVQVCVVHEQCDILMVHHVRHGLDIQKPRLRVIGAVFLSRSCGMKRSNHSLLEKHTIDGAMAEYTADSMRRQ